MKRFFTICLLLALVLTLCLPLSLKAETAENTAGETEQKTEEAEPIDSALTRPAYPETPAYPMEQDYFDPKSGEFDSDAFELAHDPWWNDKQGRRQLRETFSGDFGAYYARSSQEILLNNEEINPVYSPLSLFFALSMLGEVTDGKSRDEILQLLGEKDLESARTDAMVLWNSNYSADGAVSSKLANSFWLNQGLPYKEAVLKTLSDRYFASSFSGEMGAESYNQDLQRWINGETGNLLEKQAGDLNFDPNMVFALVSTIFYQAKWQNEFQKSANDTKIFHGSTSDVERTFMNSEMPQSYYWADNFGAVQKPLHYGGSVWLVLPDEDAGVEAVLKNPKFYELTSKAYADESWEDSKQLMVHLSLPRFDVASNLRLEENMKKLGVNEAFDQEKADFSPLFENPEQRAFLSKVRQGSRVAMDEQGVTAAAFTAMMMCGAAAPPEERMDFILDRPFIFVLCGLSGDPLFIGAVNQMDPEN